MIAHKKVFYAGFGLIVIFTIVLIILFMPVFGGQNALENLDMLYNSISKGSAYYIPKAKKTNSTSKAGGDNHPKYRKHPNSNDRLIDNPDNTADAEEMDSTSLVKTAMSFAAPIPSNC